MTNVTSRQAPVLMNNRNLIQRFIHYIYKYMIKKEVLTATIAALILTSSFAVGRAISEIPTSQVNIQVNYLDEMLFVTAGSGGSTKLYMSADNMKTWEMLETNGVIDMSALLKSKEVTLYFKGNKDTTPVLVTLQGEDPGLKASYQVSGGVGRITITGATGPLEFRKGSNGQWRPVTANDLNNTSIYELRGLTLQFRTIATTSKRAGKISSVKVPKKPSAPSVKYDGGKLNFTGLKSGQTVYRVGDNIAWYPFDPNNTKLKALDQASLYGTSIPHNSPLPAITVEFQTRSTDKKVASVIKTIEIPAQPMVPNTITLNGTTLVISDPDKTVAYEYTIVPKFSSLNLATARWTTVTSTKPVVISKAAIGDKIAVRLKSTTDSETKQVTPASTYKELVVVSLTN